MNRLFFIAAFLLGASAVIWMASTFVGTNNLALAVTLVIAGVYVIGFMELVQFRAATSTLSEGLAELPEVMADDMQLMQWQEKLHLSLRNAVAQRIEGERVGLPAPVITPYLVGLLVMLGRVGTFVGMVETLSGAVIALEGTTELQAIRAGLAAPINGLSVAFGTSVAGIAASAMLGLISTLTRRDRMLATRVLDGKISTVFRSFSLAHNRQETYKALQIQTQALPDVAEKLTTVAQQLSLASEQLSHTLIASQKQFHESAQHSYTALAASVDASLKTSLADSGRLAGESIRPVVEQAMAEMSREAQASHQVLTQTAQRQLESLAATFSSTSEAVSAAWQSGLGAHAASNEKLVQSVGDSLNRVTEKFEDTASSLATKFGSTSEAVSAAWQSGLGAHAVSNEKLVQSVGDSLNRVTEKFEDTASSLATKFGSTSEAVSAAWQSGLGAHAVSNEKLVQSVGDSLNRVTEQFEGTATSLLESFGESSTDLTKQQQLADAARLELWASSLSESQQLAVVELNEVARVFTGELVKSTQVQQASLQSATTTFESMSGAVTAQWEGAGEQIAQLNANLKAGLDSLRDAEEQRGTAAVERLGALEAAVAKHLAALGKEMEGPMVRLIETASETPKAAAEVIGKLRDEVSNNIERDNQLLEERQRIMQQLNSLSGSLEQTSQGQREALENMVSSSTGLLQKIGDRFDQQVASQVEEMSGAADNFSGSATEMASLGEAFTVAVSLFTESNGKLMESLGGIEQSLSNANDRSDEQMNYYVAQARQIIDQSMASQREIFDEIRKLSAADVAITGEAS
jgi:cytochrome c551/c552